MGRTRRNNGEFEMQSRSLVLAGIAVASLTAAAFAGTGTGWYFGFGMGWDKQNDLALRRDGAFFMSIPPKDETSLFIGNVGYRFDNRIRLEFETGYDLHNYNHKYGADNFRGHSAVFANLVNALYDYPLAEDWTLHGGAGVGVGQVNTRLYLHDEGDTFRSTRGGFMWQGILGLTYAPSDYTEIFADYRYRSLAAGGVSKPSNGASTEVTFATGDINEHVAMLGVRFFFRRQAEAAPPPPVPAPPAPPPPALPPPPPPVTTYIVFFDFDKAVLVEKAQEVVAEAVKTAKEHGFVKIVVTGHTDTVGSDKYNMALSAARAKAVRDEMVRLGIGADEIAILGKGFHDPLVATGPGVREPQNRRAVIDLGK
jgi:OmpA-OmpF porin, OOP family